MFHSFEELCDVVSILPYSREEDKFLLVNDERSPGYWILSRKSFASKQWQSTAKELLDSFFCEGEVNNLCKLIRIWNPPGKGEIHHTVFLVYVHKENKRKDVSNRFKLFWANHEEVKQNYSRLKSPELLDFISVAKNKCLQQSARTVESPNPEGAWTKLIGDNPLSIVVEILEKHIFPDINFSAHQKLLDSAQFSRRIQIGLFAHFLVHCFPCTFMNTVTFTKIIQELGWDEKAASKLFHTADVNSTGFLSYRDFLYFMAVMEPKTEHGESTGELRSRYIFRHYDRNHDKVLDQVEMKILVDDVLRFKKKSALKSHSDVCHLVNSGGPDFTINMKKFLELVGNLKLRGTSLLLRSMASIINVFPPLLEDIRFVNFIPESAAITGALATRVVTFFPCTSESSLSISVGDRTEPRRNFEVEIHCVKLTEDGTVVDINKLNVASLHNVSPSPRRDEIFEKTFSNIYDTAQTEVLKSIKFFTREIRTKEAEAKSLKEPKLAFSWGSVDPSSMVPSLLKVCEGVTHILKEEPRLVELKPPVCALGDLHGSFPDLLLFEKAFWNVGPLLSPTTLLFLGDYVDRGPHGIEVIAYLFAHKLHCPHKITLLRGSQEIRIVQRTFYRECTDKFGEVVGKEVWNAVNIAMDCLPLAAVVGGKVFCSHGGIPPPWLCPVVSAINSVPCPLPKPDEQSPLAWELMWNEPLKKSDVTEGLEVELQAKEGFAINPSKGTGHLFNAYALERFLFVNGLSLFLRAHETQEAEFSDELRMMMLTLFSTTMSKGKKDDSTCVLVYSGKDRQKQLE